MEPSFRLANDGDLDALVELMREYYKYERLPFETSEARRALHELVGDRSLGRIWLICHGSVPIGYIVLTFGYSLEYYGRDAFVDELFLRSDYRGQGWGTRAMRYVEEGARDIGLRAIHLEVTRHNRAAQKFYRHIGFEDHDRYLMTRRIAEVSKEIPS